MTDLLSKEEPRSKGILVLEEFAYLEAADFVGFVGESRDNSYIYWHNIRSHPEGGFKVRYSQCDIVVEQHINLHLFDLPVSLPATFDLDELIFPVEIDGCLLIVDRHFGYTEWNRLKNHPWKRSKNVQAGWFAWMQAQKKPFHIAVTKMESPALTIDQIRDYLDLAPEIQISEIPSHFSAEQEYVFDLSAAKRALAKLVENIMDNEL